MSPPPSCGSGFAWVWARHKTNLQCGTSVQCLHSALFPLLWAAGVQRNAPRAPREECLGANAASVAAHCGEQHQKLQYRSGLPPSPETMTNIPIGPPPGAPCAQLRDRGGTPPLWRGAARTRSLVQEFQVMGRYQAVQYKLNPIVFIVVHRTEAWPFSLSLQINASR